MNRHQIYIGALFLILVLFDWDLKAQDSVTARSYKKRQLDPVEVDFLFGYYGQDGAHSAVTGGVGTEKLDFFGTNLVINVPVDTNKNITLDGGVDFYTSASTDRIDFRVSSASYKDIRSYVQVGYDQDIGKTGLNAGISGSFSIESDYISRGVGFSLLKSLNNDNTFLGLSGHFYFDEVGWGWLNTDYLKNVGIIYPEELRYKEWFDDGRRHTYAFSFSWTQDITPRLNAGLFVDFTYQQGLLSTPFHRVYFQETPLPKVELLPSIRRKLPVGFRLNYFIGSSVIFRTFYRFYIDSWGIRAHTASLEMPVKITPFISVYPSYRFHRQAASRYFKPFKEHRLEDEYYTSDYDLSGITSNQAGVGVRIAPPLGIFRIKWSRIRVGVMMRKIEVLYLYYARSDGMHAHNISLQISFSGY